MITVQLLGGASLRSGDDPLTGPPTQRHRIALLTLIIASWPQPLSRDRAMALLWPERDLASSRTRTSAPCSRSWSDGNRLETCTAEWAPVVDSPLSIRTRASTRRR